jgi:hypothetical protein
MITHRLHSHFSHPFRLLILSLVIGAVQTSRAALIMTVVESGGNVLATASGSTDITHASIIDTTSLAGPGLWGEFGGFIRVGGPGGNIGPDTRLVVGVSGPGAWIRMDQPFIDATTSSPGKDFLGARSDGNQVYLPAGYVSGTPINAFSLWAGHKLASLGLTPGSYKWTWGTGSADESLTITVIPEPSASLIVIAGIVGLARRRRL